jgi:hypothetical protein
VVDKIVSRAVMAACADFCSYCGQEAAEIDHIIPRTQGGSDVLANLAASCVSCNRTKSGKRLPPHLEQEALDEAKEREALVILLINNFRKRQKDANERRTEPKVKREGYKDMQLRLPIILSLKIKYILERTDPPMSRNAFINLAVENGIRKILEKRGIKE